MKVKFEIGTPVKSIDGQIKGRVAAIEKDTIHLTDHNLQLGAGEQADFHCPMDDEGYHDGSQFQEALSSEDIKLMAAKMLGARSAYGEFRKAGDLSIGGGGLTIRQHIATLMMQALATDHKHRAYQTNSELSKLLGVDESKYDYRVHWPKVLAKDAVAYADTLLEELAQD